MSDDVAGAVCEWVFIQIDIFSVSLCLCGENFYFAYRNIREFLSKALSMLTMVIKKTCDSPQRHRGCLFIIPVPDDVAGAVCEWVFIQINIFSVSLCLCGENFILLTETSANSLAKPYPCLQWL